MKIITTQSLAILMIHKHRPVLRPVSRLAQARVNGPLWKLNGTKRALYAPIVHCCMLIVPHYPAPTCTNTPHFWPKLGVPTQAMHVVSRQRLRKRFCCLSAFISHTPYMKGYGIWNQASVLLTSRHKSPCSLGGTSKMYSTLL